MPPDRLKLHQIFNHACAPLSFPLSFLLIIDPSQFLQQPMPPLPLHSLFSWSPLALSGVLLNCHLTPPPPHSSTHLPLPGLLAIHFRRAPVSPAGTCPTLASTDSPLSPTASPSPGDGTPFDLDAHYLCRVGVAMAPRRVVMFRWAICRCEWSERVNRWER